MSETGSTLAPSDSLARSPLLHSARQVPAPPTLGPVCSGHARSGLRVRAKARRGPPGSLGSPAVLLLSVLTLQFSTSLTRGEEPTLYERIASGALVVRGRCIAIGRLATVDVLEVLKGSYTGPRMKVSYRSDNLNRYPGSAKIEFQLGGDSILVLEPEKDARGRVKAGDRFGLVGAASGKIDLPAEGAAAYIEAARRFCAIQSMPSQAAIWEAQKALIEEANPVLVAGGFAEILKFRLGDESLVVRLIGYLDGPRPEFRRQALRVLGQMFSRQRRTGITLPSSDLLARETLARATGDESPETRAEAVRTLRELRRPDLAEPLTRLASRDPSQMVRYEAEVALFELRQTPW